MPPSSYSLRSPHSSPPFVPLRSTPTTAPRFPHQLPTSPPPPRDESSRDHRWAAPASKLSSGTLVRAWRATKVPSVSAVTWERTRSAGWWKGSGNFPSRRASATLPLQFYRSSSTPTGGPRAPLHSTSCVRRSPRPCRRCPRTGVPGRGDEISSVEGRRCARNTARWWGAEGLGDVASTRHALSTLRLYYAGDARKSGVILIFFFSFPFFFFFSLEEVVSYVTIYVI